MIVYRTKIMVRSCARQESTQRNWHRRGLLTRRPLLCTTPPEPDEPEDINNKAEMSRFPPIRSQMHQPSGRKCSDFCLKPTALQIRTVSQ